MRVITLPALLATLFVAAPAHADFEIDWGTQYTESVFWSGSSLSTHGGSCESYYADGVIRSWYLREKNFRDYRKSHNYCRDMDADGTLASGYRKLSHFSYSGSGYTGNSSIPLDKVPVGVRTWWDFPMFGDWKLVDVELLHDDAADVVDGRTDDDRAGDALNNSGALLELQCNPGYVLTGIWVKVKHQSGRAEIRGVKVECSELEEY